MQMLSPCTLPCTHRFPMHHVSSMHTPAPHTNARSPCWQAVNKTFEVRRSEAIDGRALEMGRKQWLRMFVRLALGGCMGGAHGWMYGGCERGVNGDWCACLCASHQVGIWARMGERKVYRGECTGLGRCFGDLLTALPRCPAIACVRTYSRCARILALCVRALACVRVKPAAHPLPCPP